MKVSKSIHAIKIPFKLEVGSGKTLNRFVYAYLIYEILDKGIKYIRDIHHEVLKQKAILDTADTITVAAQVGKKLGLPETALNPLFFKTIEAHLAVQKV